MKKTKTKMTKKGKGGKMSAEMKAKRNKKMLSNQADKMFGGMGMK